MYKNLRNEFW